MFKQELDYDWTYFSPYGGDLVHGTAAATPLQIDYKRLRPTPGQEIRFFDENVLFEDEMGDNGSATFLVKTVQPRSRAPPHRVARDGVWHLYAGPVLHPG